MLFFWISLSANSQIDKGLIPHSNKLLLNPSYAGLNKDTHFRSSLLFDAQPEKNLNNTLAITYDTWLEKMEGGFSLQFFQGLNGSSNTNTTGAGVGFSKPFSVGKNSQLIPSIGLNHHIATKQWFVHLIDRMIDKSMQYQSPPGEEFRRYSATRPAAGLLWNSPGTEIGLAGFYSITSHFGEEEPNMQPPLFLVFHAVKKRRGTRHGLVSQPLKTSPEITVIYAENLILSRLGIRMERTDKQFGVFLQNNFSDNIHGIGGAFGWKLNNLSLNFSAGGTYSGAIGKAGLFGEASLGLTIPYVHINEKNPWAPLPRSF